MKPFRDDELINHPAIRRAVLAQAAAASEPAPVRSGRGAIGWLIIIVVIGLIGLSVICQLVVRGG